MAKIQGVILDWAGTAVDFGSTSPMSAFKEAFRRAGVEVTDDETRAPMGLLKRDHIRTMLAMPRIATCWKEKYGREANSDDVEKIYADFEPALPGGPPRESAKLCAALPDVAGKGFPAERGVLDQGDLDPSRIPESLLFYKGVPRIFRRSAKQFAQKSGMRWKWSE